MIPPSTGSEEREGYIVDLTLIYLPHEKASEGYKLGVLSSHGWQQGNFVNAARLFR